MVVFETAFENLILFHYLMLYLLYEFLFRRLPLHFDYALIWNQSLTSSVSLKLLDIHSPHPWTGDPGLQIDDNSPKPLDSNGCEIDACQENKNNFRKCPKLFYSTYPLKIDVPPGLSILGKASLMISLST
jgi:hypothetical protein